jgi:hypothetical protein
MTISSMSGYYFYSSGITWNNLYTNVENAGM